MTKKPEKKEETTDSSFTLTTPVLLVVFNRPKDTKQVLTTLARNKPPRLYIAADGPRTNKAGEKEKCRQVREVVSGISWDCEVFTLMREQNVGCKLGVSGAIDWFFSHEEQGIILEDDCVPSDSFFRFCQELLERYKDDNRVMHISGTNPHPEYVRDSDYSYYYSCLGSVWGWATWRRAWDLYDIELKYLEEIVRKGYHQDAYYSKLGAWYYIRKIYEAYSGELNTWDYQWYFTHLMHSGLSITPQKNMVENIGFGPDATHTFSSKAKSVKNKNTEVEFPLKHPPFMIRNVKADNRQFKLLILHILKRKLFSILKIPGFDASG